MAIARLSQDAVVFFLRIKKRASAGTGGSRITAAQVWDYAKGKCRHGRIPYETKLV